MTYKIKVNDKIIELDIKNSLTEIYGANGVGKTTISKYFSESVERCFVFNEQYVYDNVYSIDENIKVTGNQKKKIGRTFISQEYKNIYNKVQLLSNFKSENKKDIENINKNFMNIILNKEKKYQNLIQQNREDILEEYNNWMNLLLRSDYASVNEFKNTLNFENLNDEKILSAEIISFEKNKIKNNFNIEKLEQDYSHSKYGDLILQYNNFVENNDFDLDENFIDLIKEYNLELSKKSEYQKAIKVISNNLHSLNIIEPNYNDANNSLFTWIKTGIDIHKEYHTEEKVCLYCGTKNFNIEWLNSYKLIFENRISKLSREILSQTDKLIKFYKNLRNYFNMQPKYKNIVGLKKIIEDLENILYNNPFDKSIIKKLNNQEAIDLNIIVSLKLNIKKIKLQQLDISNLFYFILNQNLESIIKNSKPLICEKRIESILLKLNKELAKENLIIKKKIDKLLKELNSMQLRPFDFTVEFNPSRGNSKNKEAELVVKNKDGSELVGVISTGQRNNLALMYFIAEAKTKIENQEIDMIVIDDPVDGGDLYSYFLMKSFIMTYFSNKKTIKVVILTHNFDYLLIQLTSTDKFNKYKRVKDYIDILKITDNGKVIPLSKEEINSDNKTVYFHLTDFLSKNKDISCFLFATWIIWTRKMIEEVLVDSIKLNSGKYVPDIDQFKFIEANKSSIFNVNCTEYLNNKYYDFISGKILYNDMILETKNIMTKLFKNINYLNSLVNIIKEINYNLLNTNFDKTKYLFSDWDNEINNNCFLIKIANDSAKLMISQKLLSNKDLKQKRTKIIEDISNYIKHAGNNVSRPVVALEVDSILKTFKDIK